MEELLNKLIEKGWKPRGLETKRFDGELYYAEIFEHYSNGTILFDGVEYSIRELISKESGLWPFVCNNNLIQTEHWGFIDNGERAKNVFYKVDKYDEEGDIIQTGDMKGDKFIGIYEPEYRLIESALCDEDKLEDFLLNNIKV